MSNCAWLIPLRPIAPSFGKPEGQAPSRAKTAEPTNLRVFEFIPPEPRADFPQKDPIFMGGGWTEFAALIIHPCLSPLSSGEVEFPRPPPKRSVMSDSSLPIVTESLGHRMIRELARFQATLAAPVLVSTRPIPLGLGRKARAIVPGLAARISKRIDLLKPWGVCLMDHPEYYSSF
jgi:hypothetical protein